VQGASLTGTALDGVRIEASGSGVVNATVLNSLIDAATNPITAITFDVGSDISLNASGNYPAPATGWLNPIVLDNGAGGLLTIDQGSTAAMSTANNGVGVAPIGIISTGGNTPPPPPPTP